MDLKTLREYEAFLKAIEGRQNSAGAKFKDTFVEVAEAAGKLKEVQKEIVRIEEGYNKELKRGIDLSKSFNKSKSDSNIQAAKLLGINKISVPNGFFKCPESKEMDFGRVRANNFSIIFWARRRKAVRQGLDLELFMTELSCHQLGANSGFSY